MNLGVGDILQAGINDEVDIYRITGIHSNEDTITYEVEPVKPPEHHPLIRRITRPICDEWIEWWGSGFIRRRV